VQPETLFSVCSFVVVPAWILLVVAPRWQWTARLIGSSVISLLLAGLYLVLVATHLGRTDGGFGSLKDVSTLFQNPAVLLAGWIHYLVFDLFIGGWEVRDSQRLGIPHAAVIPCLILTFLFGPIGFLLYFALRIGLKGRLMVEAEG
jgi:hypothetical protein